MNFQREEALEILSRTPMTVNALLRGLSDGWTRCTEGENTWSPFDIVGHLIHGEKTDWIQRARIIIEQGESRPFEPFDRFAQFESSRDRTMDSLLEEFTTRRAANIAQLNELLSPAPDLGKTGLHPAFGRVTLHELLSTWVAHDLNHIHQIVRVMAKRYREDVGPWGAYLNILSI